jgi:hypothetical protein
MGGLWWARRAKPYRARRAAAVSSEPPRTVTGSSDPISTRSRRAAVRSLPVTTGGAARPNSRASRATTRLSSKRSAAASYNGASSGLDERRIRWSALGVTT